MIKKTFHKRLAIALSFAGFWGVSCSDALLTTSDGGGSETINAKIIISDTIARFEAGAKYNGIVTLRVFSNTYKPFERIGFIDSLSGSEPAALEWNAPVAGDYNFYLSLDTAGKAAFIPGIRLKKGTRDTFDCAIKKCLPFKGKIISQASVPSFVLFIQGSPFYCISDSLLRFSMPQLPSGLFVVKMRPLKGRLFMPTNDYIVNTDSLGENVNLSLKE
jgi:hypothetical protein